MKERNVFALGQKIPASIQPFSRPDIETTRFSVRHSSIFRILTKWAEYLESIFKNPQQVVKGREYPFLTIDNRKV